jgi:Uma2 family endonuclease
MATVTKLGPLDHGRAMTWEEFQTGDYEEGYQYELINGRLYVSPVANLSEGASDKWLFLKVNHYSCERPKVVNYVSCKARVFIPDAAEITAPEPDLAAYHDFPLDRLYQDLDWEDVSPILVGEVLSPGDPAKDMVRNVALYFQIPTIKEYWVLDPRGNPEQPVLHVFRRQGRRWKQIEVAYGQTYTTRLLPGFELLVDPRK